MKQGKKAAQLKELLRRAGYEPTKEEFRIVIGDLEQVSECLTGVSEQTTKDDLLDLIDECRGLLERAEAFLEGRSESY